MTRALCAAAIALGLAACLGCSWGHRHYKPAAADAWKPACKPYERYFDANDFALAPAQSLASNICVSDGGLSIGVIEFDDEGTHWNRAQLRQLEQEIERIGAAQAHGAIPTRGILLVSFVHGWGNSGSEGSRALLDFRKISRYIASAAADCAPETPRPARGGCPPAPYVVAVYLAWHGDSLGLASIYAKTGTRRRDWLAALRLPTFWARKSAARRAGGMPMTETLLRLLTAVEAADLRLGHGASSDAAGPARDRSRSIVIGHSLGAGVVEQALARAVVAGRMERTRLGLWTDGPGAAPMDNLVVLLNPAKEALSAANLIVAMETMGAPCPDAVGNPAVVSIASSADLVTRRVFPGGLYLGRMLTLRPTNRMRERTRFGTYGKLLTRSAVHHPGIQTHWLRRQACADGVDIGAAFRVGDVEYRLCRRAEPAHEAPYWVFAVPPELLPNHRDVFTPGLFDFILKLPRGRPVVDAPCAAPADARRERIPEGL